MDERVARGQTARQDVPRPSHGRWKPAPDRPDPVALLEEQADQNERDYAAFAAAVDSGRLVAQTGV